MTDRIERSGQGRARAIAPLVVALLLPWPLLLGPGNWWAFILVTAAIAVALGLVLGPQWPGIAGLKMPTAHILLVIVAFASVATGSKMLLAAVYQSAGLVSEPPGIAHQIGFLFQALNEEILFRALMIGLIIHYVRSAPLVSVGLALLITAAHFCLYRFSNPMHLALSLGALATLFFAFAAMNNLYLIFRHVGFSWALHAGWNVVWLPAPVHDAASHELLHEPQLFDRVLGSPTVMATAFAMAVLSFVFLVRRPSPQASS
jgi:hypothetical protein